jgi:hypothetical protein
MKKPVKKFNGGLIAKLMAKAAPQIKKAEGQKESAPGVMAAPRTLVGRVATAAANAAKNAPASSARPQGRGIVGRVAQAAGTAAQRVKLPGLKKGGAVTKKAVKKTARKK